MRINPIISKEKLENRYNLIEDFVNKNIASKIGVHLENIFDIDKIIRKCQLLMVDPFEIYRLIRSLESYTDIIKTLDNENIDEFKKSSNKIDRVNKVLSFFNECFDYEILSNTRVICNVYFFICTKYYYWRC